jgi:hypothetical protein
MTSDGPAGGLHRGWRALLALLALAATAATIHAIFASGFGRPHPPPRLAARPPATEPPTAAPPPVSTPLPPRRRYGVLPAGERVPVRLSGAALAVVADGFWLTYLPEGLRRTGGGVVESEPGVEGAWARFGTAARYVEVQVEYGAVAAGWRAYRRRIALTGARDITVRGRPALVGGHPSGGLGLLWLERPGTGAWIRVGDALAGELVEIAASVRAPVGE